MSAPRQPYDAMGTPDRGDRYTVRPVPGLGTSIQFHQRCNKPVLIIRPDGRIELGEGCTNAEAAQALVDLANQHCRQQLAVAPSAWLLLDSRGDAVGATCNKQEADNWCTAPWRTVEPLFRGRKGIGHG